MASLQAYQSHGIQYYRIVESFRNNGKPSIRVLAHLGRVDDILQRHQEHTEVPVKISSVSATALPCPPRSKLAATSRKASCILPMLLGVALRKCSPSRERTQGLVS